MKAFLPSPPNQALERSLRLSVMPTLYVLYSQTAFCIATLDQIRQPSQGGTVAETSVSTIDERYRVQSLGRALDLVELIANRGKDGARLTDLARELGMSKAAVYALLQTLLAHGFLSDFSEGA